MSKVVHRCTIVGISGASASGKSLIAKTIYNELRHKVGDNNIGIIDEDCYYKSQDEMTMEEKSKVNYDHPNSMDHDLLFHHLQLLKIGKGIHLPQYDYTNHTRKNTKFFLF